MTIRWSKLLKWLLLLFLVLGILLNVVLYNHAYYFTHFGDQTLPRLTTAKVQQKPWSERLKLGFFGVEIPKSRNKITPAVPHKTVRILGTPALETWYIPTERPVRGIAALFHGYASSKASLLYPAEALRAMGYHTLLVDFRGHGDSEGSETTIGYREAEDVRRVCAHIAKRHPDLPLVLMGTSMGSVSILKALSDYDLQPEALVLECPFESMRTAIERRFELVGVDVPLLPDLLLFWGGWQLGMDAFGHNCTRYAQQVQVPTLLLHGKHDELVTSSEITAIETALLGPHQVVQLESKHDYMAATDPVGWKRAVWQFLDQ